MASTFMDVVNALTGIAPHKIMHRVLFGETIGKIAKMYYGDYQMWPLIYSHNWHAIDNPDILQPGLSICIPYDPKLRIPHGVGRA